MLHLYDCSMPELLKETFQMKLFFQIFLYQSDLNENSINCFTNFYSIYNLAVYRGHVMDKYESVSKLSKHSKFCFINLIILTFTVFR